MTESAGRPAAGWYDDPHTPGQMRYFDGETWTNHFHQPGKLPELGTWFSTMFAVFRDHWIGASTIAIATTLVSNALVWASIGPVLGDLAIVDDELVNFEASRLWILPVVALAALLWQGCGRLALNRYLQRAHFQDEPTIGEAFTRALQRLPKLVGVFLLGVLGLMVAFGVLVVLALVSPALAVVAGLAMVVGVVFVVVKVAFLEAAIVLSPSDTSVLGASAGVSRGRFWPVLGRILLVTLSVGIAASIISSVTGGFASPVDQDVLSDVIVTTGDNTIVVRDFSFRELIPSGPSIAAFVIFNSLVGAASAMITVSAFVRLYLDSGAPSEL